MQVDGERLAPSHDEALHPVELRAVVCVVELTLQVPSGNVQCWEMDERERKETVSRITSGLTIYPASYKGIQSCSTVPLFALWGCQSSLQYNKA